MLSAERVFQCPDRYLFDPATRLCQRAEKVLFVILIVNNKNKIFTTQRKLQLQLPMSTLVTLCIVQVKCPNTVQFYSFMGPLVVQLEEQQLDTFFSLPLTYQVA